jgi:hypothetical protein
MKACQLVVSLHGTWMHWTHRIERKFSWMAIPGLFRILVMLQALVFIVFMVRSAQSREAGEQFIGFLSFDKGLVLQGEVWRLVSFVFVPATMHVIFTICALLIKWMIGNSLEELFGAFWVTVFIGATMLGIVLGLWFQNMSLPVDPLIPKQLQEQVLASSGVGRIAPILLDSALTLLFGVTHPRYRFLIYGIIPVSAWVLAVIAGGNLVWLAVTSPLLHLPILGSVIPFLVYAVPKLYSFYLLKNRVWEARRARAENSLPASDYFSKCHVCGRTDASNPELNFRIAEDGTEYCQEHLSRGAGSQD